MINKTRFGRILTVLLIAVMSLSAASAFAASKSSAPTIEDIEYEGRGEVKVEFYGDVRYKNAKVSVTDSKGTAYTAKIFEKDDDDLEFRVSKIKTGMTYNFTITGIRKATASTYTSVKGTFKVPDPKEVTVESVEYDGDDRELSIEFKDKVVWQKSRPTVKVTNMSGTTVKTSFIEKDNDSIDVRAKLRYGAKYKYSISGVKAPGATSYTTISGTFYANED